MFITSGPLLSDTCPRLVDNSWSVAIYWEYSKIIVSGCLGLCFLDFYGHGHDPTGPISIKLDQFFLDFLKLFCISRIDQSYGIKKLNDRIKDSLITEKE